MRRAAALLACLCAAFLVFFAASRTPAPAPITAPATAFSAGRALSDIGVVARTPHPNGSPEIAAVRAYLLARMGALGLSPRVQTAESVRAIPRAGSDYLLGGEVANLIGVLPGRDRSLPALALMAHYDTVPGSPGAADDTTGVAVALETVRAIAARGTPERDVAVVLTDGEELGLLGAHAFYASDPEARRIGFVINLEARGGGGRAAMFQTGDDDGAAVALFSRAAKQPDTTSLTPFLYRYLPNDTDFTVVRAHGLTGFNIAFIGRQFDYHSPSSTVAALDQGSVQHMGGETLGPAEAVAFSRVLPPRTPDLVFADVFGLGVIHYPPIWGWLPVALSAALILAAFLLAWRRAPLSPLAIAGGALAGLGLLGLDALVLFLARLATGVGSGWFAYRPILARFPLFEAALCLCALGVVVAAAALAGRRGRGPETWIGFLYLGLLATSALQAVAPLTAFVLAWPLLAASLCAAVTSAGTARSPWPWLLYAVVAVPALAWVGAFFHALLQGLDAAPACALFAWLTAMILWPLAAPSPTPGPRDRPLGLILGAALVVAGVVLTGSMRLSPPWSVRYPRAVTPMIVERDGHAWRASLPPVDPWTRAFLGPGPVVSLAGVPGEPPLAAVAEAGVTPSPAPVALTSAPNGGEALTAAFDAAARDLTLQITADTPLSAPIVDGTAAGGAVAARTPVEIHWRAQPGAMLRIRLTAARPGAVTVRYALDEGAWPVGAAPIRAVPSNHMAWGDPPPTTLLVGDLRGKFAPS